VSLSPAEKARDIAFWLSAAFIKRRLYSSDSASVRPNLQRLVADLEAWHQTAANEVFSIGVMSQGVSLGGQPVLSPPEGLARFAAHLKLRGFGVVNIARGASLAELETLIALLNLDSEVLAATDVQQWLKDRGAEHVEVKHLEVAESRTARSMGELYAMGEDTLARQFKRVGAQAGLELSAIKEFAGTMLDMVTQSDVPIATMVALRNRDDYSFKHSVNVSLLAGAQAAALGLEEELVREISIAGLLHDLGKTMVPEAVLHKKTPRTPAEQQMIAAHAEEGARIILRTHGGDGLAAIVAAEHHLPYTEDTHLASQLVAIGDVFDSLRTLAPFATREKLRPALSYMLERLGSRLNPYLVQRFCVMCGMFAVGDVVQLNSGELARVVSTHAEFGARPVLEVVDRGTGHSRRGTVVDLSLAKTQTTIATLSGGLEGVTMDALEALA
jgi:putative nucleotidyltransferase with HDIG domain